MPKSPHKTRPLLLFRVYKPKYGGRKFAFRLGSLILYGLAVWNPYWLAHHPGTLFVHPQRIASGIEIVFRLWKLHSLLRLQYTRFLVPVFRPRIKHRDEPRLILEMAAHMFANRTFSPNHPYGSLGKQEKRVLFWDAVRQFGHREEDDDGEANP